jgi:hypothetical protein
LAEGGVGAPARQTRNAAAKGDHIVKTPDDHAHDDIESEVAGQRPHLGLEPGLIAGAIDVLPRAPDCHLKDLRYADFQWGHSPACPIPKNAQNNVRRLKRQG